MNHKRLWTMGNKLRASDGRVWGDWDRPVTGIKEGTYCMGHWVLCANNESWRGTWVAQSLSISLWLRS